jgi:hypothetical protein
MSRSDATRSYSEQMAYAVTVAMDSVPALVKVTVQPVAGVELVPPLGVDAASTSLAVALDPPPPMA